MLVDNEHQRIDCSHPKDGRSFVNKYVKYMLNTYNVIFFGEIDP